MKTQRPIKSVVLTAFLGSGAIQGSPGDEIPVTDENRADVERLIADRGCQVKYDDSRPTVLAATLASTELSSENDDDNGLSDVLDGGASVDVLAEHKIAARYIAALKEAQLLTIADVRGCEALAATPGLNDKVAAKIREAVAIDEA
jgi:hypothetical protein